ncbi:MAG: NAD(P)/FAD-dependent oxidoreductase [Nocardioidaceae bacterium]
MSYRSLSLWHELAGDVWRPRPALADDVDVDVAIVGAGFTGLWTAYYLKAMDPGLRIAVLEAEVAGFGASGRNGGWVSALFPASRSRLARLPGSSRGAAMALTLAMRHTVDEVGRVVEHEDIDCGFHKGGTVVFARTASQLLRARGEVAEARAWGDTSDDLRFLSPIEAVTVGRAEGVLGATYTPHCARVQPAALASGLAAAVERSGVKIYEQTAATSIAPSAVVTSRGTVRAAHVVRATEGFTPALPGQRRKVIPVYSLIVATEPLPAATWSAIGLEGRATFSDHRHLVIYGQRSVDDRLVFGGRGAPYHFGSTVRPEFDREERVFGELRATLRELFPAVDGAEFTHAWGGPLGIARDWMASVGLDRRTGLAWAGGYVGDGVATANLAGRTLADLICGRDTELTQLPWVNHRSRSWEPEPLRWLGVNAGLRMMTAADREEDVTHRESRLARLMAPLTGGH